ncbi:MAG: aminodeoxychorismate synthase component I [Muricoprocola sp.]
MTTTVKKLSLYKEAADIFSLYYEQPDAVFLDSSLKNSLGKFSIIGLHPYLKLEETDGVLYQNGQKTEGSIEDALSSILKENKEVHDLPLPLIAGAIGFFSYDYGRKFEHIATRHPKRLMIPDALFVFYDNLIIEDKDAQVLYVTARGELSPAEESIQKMIQEIEDAQPCKAPEKGTRLADFRADFVKADYKQAVDDVINYIIEGDIYIANMTQQLIVESTRHPYDVFRYLRTHNPSPFGGYFNYGDFQIASASPERFMLVKDGVVETRPIKGTRPRGTTVEEDLALKQELADSSKDKSELLMVVDLERNDLNHVCVPGSVKVTRHFDVETYATVFHLVTTIIGKLRPELDVLDLIRAAFPGGSITGTPKIRAMEIIDELERSRRGLYTGSIGYLSLDGSCDLNIVIRTAVYQEGRYHLGVGGGITCESDLEFEYEETLQKAKAVLEAIENS